MLPVMAPATSPQPPAAGDVRTSCKSVVHIGDSTSFGLISATVIPDPNRRIDAQYRRVGVLDARMEISGARSIVEVLRDRANARDTAASQRASGFSGCWVFALGTTDTANLALAPGGVSREERIDRMMAIADGDPVMWVNTRTVLTEGAWSNRWMKLWNQELSAAQMRYANLVIYDWAAVAETSWFAVDGIHYTTEGYTRRAVLVANALAEFYPG